MKFKKYINEWKSGSDSDYPASSSPVIIFDIKDEYKLKGKTHGLISHAIKHGQEFFPVEYNNIINKIIDYIKNINFHILNRNGDISSINNYDKKIIINTLDRINDKKIVKKQLTPEEKYIFDNFISKIGDLYSKAFFDIIDDSISLTNIDSKESLRYLINSNKDLKIETKDRRIIFFNSYSLFFGISFIGKGRASLYKIDSKKRFFDKLKQFDYKNKIFNDIIKEI